MGKQMPYKLVRRDGKFAVQTIATGRLHGLTTKKKAEAQKRLLEMIMKKGGK
jgi:hypothetical protein